MKTAGWVLLGLGGAGGFYLYERNAQKKKEQAEAAANEQQQSNEATTSTGEEYPDEFDLSTYGLGETATTPENLGGEGTEEFPYSIGGLGGGEGASAGYYSPEAEAQRQQLKELAEGNKKEREEAKAQREAESKANSAFFSQLTEAIGKLGSGGGAPTASTPAGVTSAPPSQSSRAETVTPAPAPIAVSEPTGSQASSNNQYTGNVYETTGSSVVPSEIPEVITCPNGCEGHKYANGRTECQVKCPGPKNAGHPKGLYCQWRC